MAKKKKDNPGPQDGSGQPWQGGPQQGQWQGPPQGQGGPGQPWQGDPQQGQWQGAPGQTGPVQPWQGPPQGDPSQWQGGPQGPGQQWQGQPPQGGDPSQWQGDPQQGQWQGAPGQTGPVQPWQGPPQGDPSQWQGGPQGPGQQWQGQPPQGGDPSQWQGAPGQTGPVQPWQGQPQQQPPAQPQAPQPQQPVTQQPAPQFVVVPAAPQKGNGGLVGGLVAMLLLLVASTTAIVLLFTGVIVSPFVGGPSTPVVSGTPTTTFFAPAQAAGANAFVPGVSTVTENPSIPAATIEIEGTAASAAPVPSAGDTSGLYGLDGRGCTRGTIYNGLKDDPGKAAAWAAAVSSDSTIAWQGGTLSADDIRMYLFSLTGLTLTADTWVIDHGYSDAGQAVETPLLLQKGTMVFVDVFGMPRIRCISANVLTLPEPETAPVFTGTAWPDFVPEAVVSVVPAGLLTQFPVSVPATPAGSIYPLVTYPCDSASNNSETVAASCEQPGPGFLQFQDPPAIAMPDGVTKPTAAGCSSNADVPFEQAEKITSRFYNATGESLYIFTVDPPAYNCETWYYDELGPNSASNGNRSGFALGTRVVVSKADGTIVTEQDLVDLAVLLIQ